MAASVRDVQNLVTTVVGLQGNPVSPTVPAVGDTLVWDGTAWSPAVPSGGGSGRFVPQLDPSNDVAVSCPGGPSTAPFISAFEAPVSADGDSLGIRLQRDVDGTAIFLRGPTFPDPSIANGMQFWLGDGGNLLFAFTPTGQITLPAMPVGSMDATPRQYVDDAVAANGWPALGVTDGSDAAAGQVGEYLVNQAQGGLVSGTAANIGSLSLTPGDWDVSGNVALRWIEGSVAANIQVAVGINTTPAVLPSGLGFNGAEGSAQLWVGTPNNGESSLVAGPKRYNVTTATTVYLNVQSFWSGADNPNVVGTIRARRMR